MIAHLDAVELEALLKDFHLLTGIKIAVFDTEGNELIACPSSHCLFCEKMQRTPHCRQKCMESNRQSFQHCQKTGHMIIYHCHAGLVEATAPLVDNGMVIGYIMFGQITDAKDEEALNTLIRAAFERYGLPPTDFPRSRPGITKKSTEQIQAAARILEACTFYVLFKRLMYARRQNFAKNLDTYLKSRLEEDLTADQIAADFHISRSKLYASCEKYLGMGIAAYLKNLRLTRAKELLLQSDLTVSQIALKTGFSDCNYFCRVFKKETGLSARKYRTVYS